MSKTRHKKFAYLFFFLLILLNVTQGKAQETPLQNKNLITYIQELEGLFNIKFSYVDEDIRPLQIRVPNSKLLSDILAEIHDQTQLKIQKLSERYYTLAKSTTVDICALVLDNFEKNTVPGATVEVLGSTLATITDFNGRFFFLNIPRKAVLQIKHLGFKPQFVVAEDLVNHNPCTTVLLAQSVQQLDEVVVVQFLTTGIVKQSDGSILISPQDFGILPGSVEPDVLQTVQALPGIKSTDETVSDINIRGGTNDQNLILWDGIKMYQSGHFFGLISAFNPYLTDKIAIIKNGASAAYGDGVSGIIDMRTTNEIPKRYRGGAGLNLISGDVNLQFPASDKLGFQFSARRSITDLLDTPTYEKFSVRAFQDTDVTRNNDFYFYDFTGKIFYDLNDRQKLRFSFIKINNQLDYFETSQDGTRSSESNLNQSNLSFGGSLESRWSDVFSTQLNAYYTHYGLDSRSVTANGQQLLLQNNRVTETGLKINSTYILGESLEWLNGYQLTETGIENATDVSQPPFKSDITEVVRTHAVFSELCYTAPGKNLVARGGIRVNHFENLSTFNEFTFEPRVNINYAIARDFNAELQGEFKSQATNQIIDLEQNFLGIEKRRWILSDGDQLPLTKSKQGSLGFNLDRRDLYIGLEGFYKEVNGISTRTQGFQNEGQFNGEIGKYAVKGIEFLINKKTVDYSMWFSYAFNQNNYVFEDIVPSQFPNNLDIRHTFTLAGTYTYNRFKFSLGLNYRTGKPYTKPSENNPIDTTFVPYTINYSEPNGNRLPEYIRADASAIYAFHIGQGLKASAGVSVLNITNRKNILNTYYRLDSNNEIETIENISLGLTPNLSFRVRF
jgi:outer membrane cobalamin receptor